MRQSLVRCVASLLLFVTAPSGLVFAQPKPGESGAAPQANLEEAQRRYTKAVELFNEGSFDAALLEFRRAYELAPNWKILYNIGQVYRQLNDYARALEAFQRYIREGGSDVPPQRAAEVKDQVEKLQGRVASLEITTNVAGAEVSVDDFVVGKTPLDKPVMVNAGRRKVSVAAVGRLPQSRVIEAAGGDKLKLPFDLPEPTPAASSTSPSAQPPTTPVEPERKVAWVPLVAGGALLAGGAVTGVLALSASSDFKKKQDTFNVSHSDLQDAQSKARTFGLVTDVLLAAGIISGGVGLYLTLRQPSTTTTGGAPGSVKVGVGPGQVQVLGSF